MTTSIVAASRIDQGRHGDVLGARITGTTRRPAPPTIDGEQHPRFDDTPLMTTRRPR